MPAEHLKLKLQLSIAPVPGAASSSSSSGRSSVPLPQLAGDLMADAVNGVATWQRLSVAAPPGRYTLTVEVAAVYSLQTGVQVRGLTELSVLSVVVRASPSPSASASA